MDMHKSSTMPTNVRPHSINGSRIMHHAKSSSERAIWSKCTEATSTTPSKRRGRCYLNFQPPDGSGRPQKSQLVPARNVRRISYRGQVQLETNTVVHGTKRDRARQCAGCN